jgi:hypothetical protein
VTDPLPGLSAITCPATTLAAAASMNCTATYVITAGDMSAGVIDNTATVTGQPPPGSSAPTAQASESVPLPAPVPTLPVIALMLLGMLLGGIAVWRLHRGPMVVR